MPDSDTLSRRHVLTAGTAAISVPLIVGAALARKPQPDAELAWLWDQRQRLIALADAAETDEEANRLNSEAFAAEDAIYKIPAKTTVGLRVKLDMTRAIADIDGGFDGQADGFLSLAKDLERMEAAS